MNDQFTTIKLQELHAEIRAAGTKQLNSITLPEGRIELSLGLPQAFGLGSATFIPTDDGLCETDDCSLVVHATVMAKDIESYDISKTMLEKMDFLMFDEKEDVEFDRFLNLDIELDDFMEIVAKIN